MMRWIMAALGIRPRRHHHRSNGPVVIDPDVAEVIHVTGEDS